MSAWHLAQFNVGRLIAPIDAPEIDDFVANLDPVNALADATPGFVWRLQDDSGNATSIHPDPDPRFIVNLSVWDSLDALEDFVRGSPHAAILRRRREWFERPAEAHLVLWWVVAGRRPSVDEALERLAHVRTNGATPTAFTFRQPFAPEALPAT
jgi:hypothetical protein